MRAQFPKKLQSGDEIRVIAPSRSLGIIGEDARKIAKKFFESLELKVSFGDHVEETDDFSSSAIESRVYDLHEAFQDANVKAIFTVIGGFNSNQLLQYIDWDLIKRNPKIFCGFSDITALSVGMYAKTGLVTYYGPHFSTFGQEKMDPYTIQYLRSCLMGEEPFAVEPSKEWTDDFWWKDQEARHPIPNEGWWLLREGATEGTIIGGNLCTLNLLQGTDFFPDISVSILFLEDDEESKPHTFDRDLQSFIHQPGFRSIKAVVIGRFQKASGMSRELLTQIISTKKELQGIPIVANVDFGHTEPKITFPIGGQAALRADADSPSLRIERH